MHVVATTAAKSTQARLARTCGIGGGRLPGLNRDYRDARIVAQPADEQSYEPAFAGRDVIVGTDDEAYYRVLGEGGPLPYLKVGPTLRARPASATMPSPQWTTAPR